jgi:glycosyltransferase involved in cell wall biosynthesis
MKIAYFNANLRKGQDGVTRCMYKMFEGAVDRGVDAIAITSTLPDPQDMIIPTYRVRSVPLPLQRTYRLALPGYQRFAPLLEKFRPDLIHINSPCTLGFGAMKYARHHGIPIVATYHTHFPTYPRYYRLSGLEDLAWRIIRYLYNRIDHTFVPTLPILEELRAHGIHNLEYLPNGVDTQLFHPNRRSEAWRERLGARDKQVLLFVSRLVWEKDLRILAGMYHRLKILREDFEMVVVGDGHARAELEHMMPGAHFLGYQSGETLAESYASSDLFVFPSTTETFGLVTLEAMASGLAPVAAKVGGAAGLIRHGETGLLAEPLDEIDLANLVAELLDNPDRRQRIAQEAHRVAQQYSWEAIIETLFERYEALIHEHRYRQLHRAA